MAAAAERELQSIEAESAMVAEQEEGALSAQDAVSETSGILSQLASLKASLRGS